MLKPNIVPASEPALRVGIILPEDKYKSIELFFPEEPAYLLKVDVGKSLRLSPGEKIKLSVCESGVLAERKAGIVVNKALSFNSSVACQEIRGQTGVKVKNVLAGRDFHWKKFIDIFLPGVIEVRCIKQNLILINELPLEQYLMCVATSEMGATCPEALIESQTIAARSWMLANVEMKHRSLGIDVCNDDCCQRYQGTMNLCEQSIKGALNTFGQVLQYAGKICDARYSKNCGGMTESFENVWGGEPIPYLKAIPDAPAGFSHPALHLNSEGSVRKWIEDSPNTFCSPAFIPEKELSEYLGSVDEEGEYFRWNFKYSQEKITDLLNEKMQLGAKAIKYIEPIKRGDSGRLIKIKVWFINDHGKTDSIEVEDQYKIRQCFHKKFLYSSAFVIDEEPGDGSIPKEFIFKGAGWGHGVGLCQIGALGMALKGYSTEEILSHYYPHSVLEKIY